MVQQQSEEGIHRPADVEKRLPEGPFESSSEGSHAWVLVFGAVLLAIVWLLGGLAIWRAHEDALADWNRSLRALSRLASQHADQTIAAADAILQRVVEMVELFGPENDTALHVAGRQPEVFEKLRQFQSALPQLEVVTIAQSSGELLNFSRTFPPPTIRLGDRDYFVAHRADPKLELFISEPVQNRGNAKWTFYLARKLRSSSGEVIGLALVGIRSDYFEDFYRTIDLGHNEPTMTLMKGDGNVLARVPENEKLMGQRMVQLAASMVGAPGASRVDVFDGPGGGDGRDGSGERETRLRMTAATSSAKYPLMVSVEATDATVLASWQDSARKIAGFLLVISIVLAMLTLFVHRLLRRQSRAMRELRDARNEADDANRAKSVFLAHMSHEIRTPLNGVLGMADLLLHTPLDDRQRKMAEAVHSSGEALLGLVNDVLDLAKVEAHGLELETIDFDPRRLIEGELELFRAQARNKAVVLHGGVDDAVPCALVGDPTRLRQVLANLLSNALKFTEHGTVVLQVNLSAAPIDSGTPKPEEGGVDPSSSDRTPAGTVPKAQLWLSFRIEDTGIGIDAAVLPRLFLPFSQADRSTTRRYGGTGLGLSIAQELVRLMGGRIDLSSQVGKGTTFTILLPFMPGDASAIVLPSTPATPSVPPVPSRPFAGLRALLAEDSPVNAMVAAAMLEDLGLEVDIAENGFVAVEKGLGAHYDLVLMDCQMPEMDGLEATRRLRLAGPPDRLIIALTAGAVAGDMEQCIAAGMNDYLSKPLTREALRTVLSRWLEPAAR